MLPRLLSPQIASKHCGQCQLIYLDLPISSKWQLFAISLSSEDLQSRQLFDLVQQTWRYGLKFPPKEQLLSFFQGKCDYAEYSKHCSNGTAISSNSNRSLSASSPLLAIAQANQEIEVLCKHRQMNPHGWERKQSPPWTAWVWGNFIPGLAAPVYLFSPIRNKELRLPSLSADNSRHSLSFSCPDS